MASKTNCTRQSSPSGAEPCGSSAGQPPHPPYKVEGVVVDKLQKEDSGVNDKLQKKMVVLVVLAAAAEEEEEEKGGGSGGRGRVYDLRHFCAGAKQAQNRHAVCGWEMG